MKKIKIMLLSLTLLAVVGGALAFKAKFEDTFCTAEAYWTFLKGYYCSFSDGSITTTKDCEGQIDNITTTNVGDQKLCTTLPLPNGNCPQDCPIRTSLREDGGTH